MLLEPFIAARYFRARRQESFVSVMTALSVIGIALGVATLIIVMSVFNGYRAEFIKIILGSQAHVTLNNPDGVIRGYTEIVARLQGLPQIEYAMPMIYGESLISSQGATSGALVRGVRPEDFVRRPLLADNLQAGDLKNFRGEDTAIIGVRMAERMGLKVGDQLTLISPRGNITPFGTVPRMKAYDIVGILEVGMFEFDNRIVFLPLEAAQLFFQAGGGVSHIEITAREPEDLLPLREAIFNTLEEPLRMQDWQQVNGQFLGAMAVERFLMFIILTLIILIASFNIISNLTMFVKDKAADIAILRTMGAPRAMILRIFFINGMGLGGLGTVCGLILGVLFCWKIETIRQILEQVFHISLFPADVYFLYELPAKVNPAEVALICAISLGISFLATLYPAWRAARVDPVEALKYE